PGGTMDEARTETLGRAHQILSNLSALTSQVERYSVDSEVLVQGRGNAVMEKNWQILNARQSAVRDELEAYAASNRSTIGDEEYRKLQQAIANNSSSQYGNLGAWAKRQAQGRDETSINTIVNGSNSLAGLAEADRDKALHRTTGFVEAANRAQQESIAADLGRGGKADRAGLDALGYVGPASGKDSTRGRISERRADEEKALKELTGELEKDSRSQLAQQQADLSKKLSQLKDNRYVRGYGEVGTGKAIGGFGPANKVGDMDVHGAGGEGAGGSDFFAPQTVEGDMAQAGVGNGSAAAGSVAPAEPQAPPAVEGKSEGGEMTIRAGAGGQAAMGTFSLPIDLPDIGVRKDFTSPGGEGTVTIWAIQAGPLAAARSTTAILTGLLLLQCCLWALRHVRQNGRPAGAVRRGLGYALLAVGGWVTWGMTAGVVVALLAAALTESARFLPRRRTA
ncbi:MAG: hypothetical protein NT031_13345, partial [Planctomycetota bacterium]|nr:hypothetical protein [Planctomycetota bacterium]